MTNLNISLGDYAHVGERVFALVDRRIWHVLGNFRETLLPAIEPGMEARVNLVGYPGRIFHDVVQGIAWSTLSPSGQAMGLLPKIDPTLNWARLAQRIPVRIILDALSLDVPFRMGMTAVAAIAGFPPDGKPLIVPGMPVASARGELLFRRRLGRVWRPAYRLCRRSGRGHRNARAVAGLPIYARHRAQPLECRRGHVGISCYRAYCVAAGLVVATTVRVGPKPGGSVTLNSGTGFGKGSRRRFLHEVIENSSGADDNHCSHNTRNDENAHELSPASHGNLQHLP